MTLHIIIVTPEKTLFDQEVDEVTLPTVDGEITVLPNHIPLLSQIAPGTIQIRSNGKTDHVAVMGGFIDVGKNTITILADYAVHAKDISTAKAQEAKDRAEQIMQEKVSGDQFIVAQKEFMKAILELKAAKKVGKIA